jgi:hypothetical protein
VRVQGEIITASLNGTMLDLAKDRAAREGRLKLFFANVPERGWDVMLTGRSDAPVNLVLEQTAAGLPAIPGMTIQPRPVDTMAAPGYPRDATIVTKSVSYELGLLMGRCTNAQVYAQTSAAGPRCIAQTTPALRSAPVK